MLMGMTRKSKKKKCGRISCGHNSQTQWRSGSTNRAQFPLDLSGLLAATLWSCEVGSSPPSLFSQHTFPNRKLLVEMWPGGSETCLHPQEKKKKMCKTRARSTNMRMNPARRKTNGCQTFCSRETDRHVTDPEGNCKQKMRFLPYARAATNTSDISLTYWFFFIYFWLINSLGCF